MVEDNIRRGLAIAFRTKSSLTVGWCFYSFYCCSLCCRCCTRRRSKECVQIDLFPDCWRMIHQRLIMAKFDNLLSSWILNGKLRFYRHQMMFTISCLHGNQSDLSGSLKYVVVLFLGTEFVTQQQHRNNVGYFIQHHPSQYGCACSSSLTEESVGATADCCCCSCSAVWPTATLRHIVVAFFLFINRSCTILLSHEKRAE